MSVEPVAKRRRIPRLFWPLFGAGLVLLLVILFFVASPVLDRQVTPPAGAVAGGDVPDIRLAVRRARPMAGTNLVLIEIGVVPDNRGGSFGSSYGGQDERRNILLLDRLSGSARRLLPNNERRITHSWFLSAQANYAPESPETGYLSDSDGPPPAYFALLVEQAGRRDRFDLLVGTLAGEEQAFVLQGLDGVDALWMQTPTQIGLLVREGLNLSYRIIDIPTLRVVQQHRVAI